MFSTNNSNNPWAGFNISNNSNNFNNFSNLIELPQDSFTIIFQKSRYICNNIAVNSSEVIREFKKSNPDSKEFEYNYDGPSENFSIIIDFFNLQRVNLSLSTMNSVRIHAENLKINALLTKIDQYIDSYDEIIQKTSPIDDIFSWLYQIRQLTVDKVTNLIINSPWAHTEAKIKELTAIILQVVRSGYILHRYLAELIISLDDSSGKNNDIGLLKPFITKQILNFFFKSKFYCHFVHQLVQKNVIQMEEVVKKIIKTDSYLHFNDRFNMGSNNNNPFGLGLFHSNGNNNCSNNDNNCSNNNNNNNNNNGNRIKLNINFERSDHENIVIWFLDEIIKIKNILKFEMFNGVNSKIVEFLRPYLGENIEEYKRKRDLCDCDNEIIKAISDDDVDTLQSIISKGNIDINTVSFSANIFYSFNVDSFKGLLNFSAEYGAVKCFKYLLLNHAQRNELTLGFAIYGGNPEIIRTIDQQKSANANWSTQNPYFSQKRSNELYDNNPWRTNNNNNELNAWGTYNPRNNQNNLQPTLKSKYFLFDMGNFTSPINIAIMTHQYSLFDWIIDEKISARELKSANISELAEISVISGNIHTFIFCCEHGFSLSRDVPKFQSFIKIASEFGYYGLIDLIMSLFKDVTSIKSELSLSPFYFGNIEIAKLLSMFPQFFRQSLLFAIQNGYDDIFQYIINKEEYQVQQKSNIFEIYGHVLEKGSLPIFNITKNKFSLDSLIEKYNFTLIDLTSLCTSCCSGGNIDIAREFIEFCTQKYPNFNITKLFLVSCQYDNQEICKYLFEKKDFINFSEIIKNYQRIFALNSKALLELIENFDPDSKKSISTIFFNESIQANNKEIFEAMLPNNSTNKQILFGAVSFNDIDLVNKVLSFNSKPSFVNQFSKKGTALHIAVENGNIDIIKRLLEVPGINPNLKNELGKTPLFVAVRKLNIEAFNLILDFYGENIKYQYWQLQESAASIKANYFQKNFINSDETLQKIIVFINRLLQINRFSFENIDFFAQACKIKNIKIVKELLKIEDINVNEQESSLGNTPLISALLDNNSELAHILIECPRTDINISNFNGQTALSIASSNGKSDIVSDLIKNPKFDYKLSNIDYSFFISNNNQVLQILSNIKELDVNFQISEFSFVQNNNFDLMETTLSYAIKQENVQKNDLIIQHPSFNPSKSNIKKAIENLINPSSITISQKIFKLVDDPNIICSNGNSLFQNLFNGTKFSYLPVFLQNTKVKLQKEELVSCFERLITIRNNMSLSIMKLLSEYDEKHEHFIDFSKLTESGKSFFTKISMDTNNIRETAVFFLEHNVDPNMPDKFGVYPLQHAIKMNMIGFVKALVDSKKIDYTVKLKETINNEEKTESYLQLAIKGSNEEIIKILFDECIGNTKSKESNEANDNNDKSQLTNILDDLISFDC